MSDSTNINFQNLRQVDATLFQIYLKARNALEKKTKKDEIEASVRHIIKLVRSEGLLAAQSFGIQFGDLTPVQEKHASQFHSKIFFSAVALKEAFEELDDSLKTTLRHVHQRILSFAIAQRHSLHPLKVPIPGGLIGHDIVPVKSAGCYAPGGRYPLPSSVLMTATTAKAAGVEMVFVASPRPTKVTLAAAHVAGADGVLGIGGPAAIAVLAYGGSPYISPCNVIVGPGNLYVTEAKHQVSKDVRIDVLAGPSELFILADDSADAEMVAADMIAQAEHDVEASAVLITNDRALATSVNQFIKHFLVKLPSANAVVSSEALSNNSCIVIVEQLETEGIACVNCGAPEHLEILTKNSTNLRKLVQNAGAIFEGAAAAEVFGDYGIGPNHTLPTSQAAKYRGGLSVFDFLKIRTFVQMDGLDPKYSSIINDTVVLAEAEGLIGHSFSAMQRQTLLQRNDSADNMLEERAHSSNSSSRSLSVTSTITKTKTAAVPSIEALKQQTQQFNFETSYLRHDLDTLMEYHPVKALTAIAKNIQKPVDEIIKLDANENIYGPLKGTGAILAKRIQEDAWMYPDPDQIELRNCIAKSLNIDVSRIVCGAGGDDLIQLIMEICNPTGIVVGTPTFPMYDFFARINRIPVHSLPIFMEQIDMTTIEKMVKKVEETFSSIVFLASPNNPTGTYINWDWIIKLCKNLSRKAMIVIDQAYIEFAEDERQLECVLEEVNNICIIRTFSKWAGLAGLRAGYCISHEHIIQRLMQVKIPYNLNLAASIAASYALENKKAVMTTLELIIKERNHLRTVLMTSWLSQVCDVWESSANFLLCKVKGKINANELHQRLWQEGILTRRYNTHLLNEFVRISIGKSCHTNRLLGRLHNIYQPQMVLGEPQMVLGDVGGILWDMDGVLADVSCSYRSTVTATAAHFGIKVSYEDINQLKNQGGFNNDWELTYQLLQDKKNQLRETPTFNEVVKIFQGIYEIQSDNEKLLVPVSDLRFLTTDCKFKMGIVTGRPRLEAKAFLQRFNIEQYFDVLMCMEDTLKHKPDPDPIVEAVRKFPPFRGNILYFGDTGDDMKAVTRANEIMKETLSSVVIIPIGLVAPQHQNSKDAVKEAQLLKQYGAVLCGFRWDCIAILGFHVPSTNCAGDSEMMKKAPPDSVTPGSPDIPNDDKSSSSNHKKDKRLQRSASVSRNTKETKVTCRFCIDGTGQVECQTGIKFLDHMIDQLGKHGNFDIALSCCGDTDVDDHHTVEDCAIALGTRIGIQRFGMAYVPLDESLSRVVVDLSGRGWGDINLGQVRDKIGSLSCEMIPHFFHTLATSLRAAIHVDVIKGVNTHHKIESCFKALAVALKEAVKLNGTETVSSTKGVL